MVISQWEKKGEKSILAYLISCGKRSAYSLLLIISHSFHFHSLHFCCFSLNSIPSKIAHTLLIKIDLILMCFRLHSILLGHHWGLVSSIIEILASAGVWYFMCAILVFNCWWPLGALPFRVSCAICYGESFFLLYAH